MAKWSFEEKNVTLTLNSISTVVVLGETKKNVEVLSGQNEELAKIKRVQNWLWTHQDLL
jgi:hypothetical protein